MKREFLEGLNLSKDVIDQIMAENGKDINAFRENTSIYEVDVRNVYKVNGGAFYFCKSLRKINLSSAVIFAGYDIFNTCMQLIKIDLPRLEELGSSTFAACFNLETVIIRTPKLCAAQNALSFGGTKIDPRSGTATGYIYVPRALIDVYRTATNWTVYAAQFRAIEDYPDICAPEKWED